MKTTIKVPEQQTRAAQITVTGEGEAREFSMSICSDEPYKRYDWWNEKEYWEVLDMRGMDEGRLKSGLPILFNHDRDQHLGRATKYSNDGKKCTVSGIIWSESELAKTKKADALSGALPDTSVGYRLLDEGVCTGEKDGLPVYRFKFEPYEGSLVTVPADPTVGVGRDAGEIERLRSLPHSVIAIDLQKEIDTSEEKGETQLTRNTHMAENAPANEPSKPTIDIVAERNTAVLAERKRVKAIQDLSEHFREKGLGGRRIETNICAADCIANGESVDDFQNKVVRGTFEEIKNNVERVAGEGMPEKDISRYSVLRAMRILSVKNNSGLDGLEGEMSRESAKNLGLPNTPTSFFIPFDVMRAPAPGTRGAALSRALATNVFSAAGALVGTDLLGGSMIELLRNKMKVLAMGARILSGLVGNIDIPKQTGGATASWLSEGSTVSASNQTVGQLQLTPHRLSANTAFTNQLLTQSSVDVENFVRQDLMTVLALARDLAAIAGTGAAGQPLGILSTTGLATSVTFANAQTMLYSDALIFENNVALQNADEGALGYMTTPTVRKNAKAIAEISAANSNPVWKDNRVNGYNAQATNQVPTATSVIFGNWNDLILADWAANQVIVDPYTQADVDQVRIIMRIFADNGLRHPTSFSVSTN